LQSDDSAAQMTDRVLTMLYQFLLSNQSLELNETFQIYLKVLSIEHSSFNASLKPRKTPIKRPRLHVGNSKHLYRLKWAIDVPSEKMLEGKCLLTCTILALLQHLFFENKKDNKLFTYVSRIQSSVKTHQKFALKLLSEELEKLFSVTGLKQTGPYELKSTIVMLSKTYKCQFFIFDGTNNCKKLFLSYPKQYDDSLKPIFLYRPSLDSEHLLFIRNLKSYFLANSFVCLACHREFKHNRSARCSHLCKKKDTCFACRRFFQTKSSYVNSQLENLFCDKLITSELSFKCATCNCTIFSKKCLHGHKRFCRGQGYFGYKCDDCKKFTYCDSQTSAQLKNNHRCIDSKMCKGCFKLKEPDHLCRMKFEKCLKGHTRLAFFKIAFDKISSEPLFAIFYREEQERGTFSKYVFFEPTLEVSNIEKKLMIRRQYFDSKFNIPDQDFMTTNLNKLKADFVSSMENLRQSEEASFSNQIGMFLLDDNYTNTTYICEDSSSINLVRIN